MKKLLFVPLVLALSCCGGNPTPSPTPTPEGDLTESVLNENMIHYLGRIKKNTDSITFAMTCSGFEIKVDVKESSNQVKANIVSSIDSTYQTQYAHVFVDGVIQEEKIALNKSISDYVLINDIPVGQHYIRFVKLNEGCFSSLTLKSLSFRNSKWSKWDVTYEKRIEFYGDSITCGYGCEGKTAEGFSLETQNGVKTYGYTCATDLGYEPSFCSQSGISLYMNAWDSPIHFEDIYKTYDCKNSFDVSKHKVDIAVIALGTNDNTKFVTLTSEKQLQEIEKIFGKYKELAIDIKTNNPNCQFFFVYNLMLTQNGYLDTAILGTCNYLNTTYGAGTAYRYEFAPNGSGCDGHPGQVAHIADGHILSDFIKNPYDID